MKTNRRQHATRDPARQVLGTAISIVGMGLVLLAISFFLASSSSTMLQPVAKGMRVAVPYAFLIGAALVVIYLVIRSKPGETPSRLREPTLFAKDTTAFGSQLDSRVSELEPAGEPVHRGLQPRATAWNAQVFRDIEWRRFEAVCAKLFAHDGLEARSQSHGADGGVDIWLHSPDAEAPAAVVQCIHWLGKPVGVKELREFHGVLASHKLTRGTFATSGTYTPDARDFARSNGISALDGQALLALISRRTPQQQKELLEIAYEGEYWRPTCANCGLKMVERVPRRRGGLFWGCPEYPRCRFTLPVRKAA